MTEEKKRKHTGECYDCGGALELVEVDRKKNTKIMKCQECGLLHHYKRGFFGGWKLVKATKREW